MFIPCMNVCMYICTNAYMCIYICMSKFQQALILKTDALVDKCHFYGIPQSVILVIFALSRFKIENKVRTYVCMYVHTYICIYIPLCV